MMRSMAAMLTAGLLLSACGPSPGAPAEAAKTAEALSGQDKLAASDNPQCRMFTAAEVSGFLGEAVDPGKTAAGGMACQWLAKDGDGNAMLQVMPVGSFSPPSYTEGYEELSAVGEKAYVSPTFGGFGSGAVKGESFVVVSLMSDKAAKPQAVAFLTEALKKPG